MALASGTKLGPYEIISAIGAGGMGEVYRARDTRLGRDVAIKILPPAFTNDPERLARFEREAHVLASLNHPNIGAIHGLEEADGVPALVLELVEGETLAERIADSRLKAHGSGRLEPKALSPEPSSGLPIGEALGIARGRQRAAGSAPPDRHAPDDRSGVPGDFPGRATDRLRRDFRRPVGFVAEVARYSRSSRTGRDR